LLLIRLLVHRGLVDHLGVVKLLLQLLFTVDLLHHKHKLVKPLNQRLHLLGEEQLLLHKLHAQLFLLVQQHLL
jgi:hypothetical protein